MRDLIAPGALQSFLVDGLINGIGSGEYDVSVSAGPSFATQREAGNNSWGPGATTLEWQLSSPPPFHQWEVLPRIK